MSHLDIPAGIRGIARALRSGVASAARDFPQWRTATAKFSDEAAIDTDGGAELKVSGRTPAHERLLRAFRS